MLHCFYLLYVTWWVISVNSSHWVGRKRSLNPALLLFRMSVVEITLIVILVTATPLFSSAATTADQS